MTDELVLEKMYQEALEESLISHIAQKKKLSLEDAMDKYYNSRLSVKIHEGLYGVQYLDYRNLAEILFETEPELFE
jgi:hypothetical protein